MLWDFFNIFKISGNAFIVDFTNLGFVGNPIGEHHN